MRGGDSVDEVGKHFVLVVDLVMYAIQLLRYEHLDVALPLRHYRDLTVYITQARVVSFDSRLRGI